MKRHHLFSRPGYITFLCALNFIGAGLLLVVLASAEFGPHMVRRPGPALVVLVVGEAMFLGISGGFMLAGKNWARIMYMAVTFPLFIVTAVYGIAHDPLVIGGSIIRFFVMACWYLALTQQRANRFFTGHSSFLPKTGDPDFSQKRSRDFDY